MKKEAIIKGVLEITKNYNYGDQSTIDPDTLDYDEKLVNVLGVDSVDIVDIVVDVEDHFNIEFIDEEIKRIETFNDLVSEITKKTDKPIYHSHL